MFFCCVRSDGIGVEGEKLVEQGRHMLLAHWVHGKERGAHAEFVILKNGAQVLLEAAVTAWEIVEVARIRSTTTPTSAGPSSDGVKTTSIRTRALRYSA